MERSNVLAFSETTSAMTFAQGIAFIDRTRRQLDRFDALPHLDGNDIDPAEALEIRRLCDELEADIGKSLRAD